MSGRTDVPDASPELAVSVVIPTYKRPAFLRSALASLRNQSRRDRIREVIVSENSDDPGSRAVCAEFADLPIRLSYHPARQPPRPYEHFVEAVAKASAEWVGLLADDDMWGRYHLEEAVTALRDHPDAVAFFGIGVIVGDDSREVRNGFSVHPHAFLPRCADAFETAWVWEPRDTLFETLLHVPVPMWSVVTRRSTALAAMEHFREPVVGMDADRYFLWGVGSRGPVIVGREATYFNRMHASNDVQRFIRDQPDANHAMAAEYTRRMLADAERLGIDPRAAWGEIAAALPRENLASFLNFDPWIVRGSFEELTRRWGAGWDGGLRQVERPAGSSRTLARDLCPPLLWRGLRWARQSFVIRQPRTAP
jgi:glycosyltransferase involved in cell wall biosynthesis